jgi:hypothetical protein
MDVQHIVTPDILAHLANSLQKRQPFDIADSSADFDDHHVRPGLTGNSSDPRLDLIGDVWDDLDRAAKVIATALFLNDRRVDLSSRDIAEAGQIHVDEPLIVPQVQIGLGAIFGDEDLAVLVGRHGTGIDVDIGIEFLDRDTHPSRLEQASNRRNCNAFAD